MKHKDFAYHPTNEPARFPCCCRIFYGILAALMIVVLLPACTQRQALIRPTQVIAITPLPTNSATPTPEMIKKTSTALPEATATRTPAQKVTATSTATSIAAQTSTPVVTPTAPANTHTISAVEVFPLANCARFPSGRNIATATWLDENRFVYGYYPELANNQGSHKKSPLQWNALDLATGEEKPTDPLIHYRPGFWEEKQIHMYSDTPELYGFFSPSGRYVIYPLWFGSVFDQQSRTEIWITDLDSNQAYKIGQYNYSNVYITRAAWFAGESKVVFSATYEGPAGFQIADLTMKTMVPLEKITGQETLATETTWRLSPDGSTLAVSNFALLQLIGLHSGKVTVIEEKGGYFPRWSADGRTLYYWRTPDFSTPQQFVELVAYDVSTGSRTTVITHPEMDAVLKILSTKTDCQDALEYLGANYEVSPNGSRILLVGDGLYLIELARAPRPLFTLYPLPENRTTYNDLPDGQYVVYQDDSSTGGMSLSAVNGDFQGRLSDTDQADIDSLLSPDGRRIKVSDTEILDLGHHWLIQLPEPVKGVLSPDLSKAAEFIQNGDVFIAGVKVYPRAGVRLYSRLDPQNIFEVYRPNPETYFDFTTWSPDGRWLAYVNVNASFWHSGKRTTGDGLYLIDTDCLAEPSTCPSKTQGPYFDEDVYWQLPLVWSPDSRSLATPSRWLNGIALFNIETKQFSTIPIGQRIGNIAWAPDGSRIASESGEFHTIFLTPLSGGETVKVFDDPQKEVRLLFMFFIKHPVVFAIDQRLTITEAGIDLRLRSLPSLTGAILTRLHPGDQVMLIDGPLQAEGYRWWKIEIAGSHQQGWVVENQEYYQNVKDDE